MLHPRFVAGGVFAPEGAGSSSLPAADQPSTASLPADDDVLTYTTDARRRELLRLKRSASEMNTAVVQPRQSEDDAEEPLDADDRGGGGEGTSLEKFLGEDNVGYRLLLRMGWAAGRGLGRGGRGRLEPVPVRPKSDSLGVGKAEADHRVLVEAAAVRKLLDVELEETTELRQHREAKAQREDEIRRDVAEMNRVFWCELCDKQYKMVSEYETHLSSYDHHHKKRLKEMKEVEGARHRDERARKEQRRQEKELQRLHDMATAAAIATPQNAAPPPPAPSSTLPSAAFQPPSAVPFIRPQSVPVTFALGTAAKPTLSGTASATIITNAKSRPPLVKPNIFGNEDDDD